MSKGELRKLRKAARAEGRPWSIEQGPDGARVVRERTQSEERQHERRMERWARRMHLDADWR